MEVFSALIWLGLTVALVIAQWRIFAKAGVPGWACLIPVYNVVKLLHITGRSGWWLVGLCVPFLNVFVPMLGFGGARYVGRGGAA